MKTILLQAVGTAMSLDGFMRNEREAAKKDIDMKKWARLTSDITRNKKHIDNLFDKIKELKECE